MLAATDLKGCASQAFSLKPERLLGALAKVGWQP